MSEKMKLLLLLICLLILSGCTIRFLPLENKPQGEPLTIIETKF